MAEQIVAAPPAASFEYELFEGDPDHLRTVVATPAQINLWINPGSLKLKHRIGRGPFGDTWLATHHQSADDYDEYHEVAVKMLHPIKEDHMQTVLDKFEELFLKCRGLQGVCWLHGISILNGKICIAMKFYEGSVGDRMAQLKGGKLPLPDVLRYGIHFAKRVLELHSIGVLVLNLKPSNLLLNEHDQVIVGDFGISYLLLGIPLPNSDMALRLGTPNYMAPEQWEPEVRGPISFETDTWGFGCSIVEMLTGIQPWFGRSIEEIYHSVVVNQEKLHIPSGLPPAVENVINGCFEYDLRNRPLIADILYAFESSQNAVYSDGGWIGIGSRTLTDRSSSSGYTAWFLSKDNLQVGDIVRSRKPLNSSKPQSMDVPEGSVVGLERDTDRDGFVLVKIHGMHNPLRVHVSTLERVTSGLVAGDWVRLKEGNKKHSSVGILHSVQRDGSAAVGFLGLEILWSGSYSELQMTKAYYVGQFVRLKADVVTPRFEWPHKRGGAWATGRISQVLPNGCLVIRFPGRFVLGDESNSFMADPAEVELVSFNTCPGLVKKYQHIEDFHWSVRPLVIAFGLFTAMKFGFFVGQNVRAKLKKGRRNLNQGDGHSQDGQTGGNSAWLPPPVANILFGEGASTATVRKYYEDDDNGKGEEAEGVARKYIKGEQEEDELDNIAARVQCMSLHKREPTKRGEEQSGEKYGLWRQEQKTRAARLEKQLKARWELEDLIEEQLNRYQAHYNRSMVPTRLKDVAQLLMPKWAPPHELATLAWLGDWRPSAILDLLRALTRSSTGSFSDPVDIQRLLSQLIHEIRIEEAVLDEEMGEIQATCILHLPFAPRNKQSGSAAMACFQSEFKKIDRVITKAQHLRFKALELVVKKVLSQTDAAEFLVAFAGIQDTIHQFAAHHRFRKGPVSVPVKPLRCS